VGKWGAGEERAEGGVSVSKVSKPCRNLAVSGKSPAVFIDCERNSTNSSAKIHFGGDFAVDGLPACQVCSKIKMRLYSLPGILSLGY
jgi:hypothetical protein